MVATLSSADSGANVLVDVGTAEEALCSSMFRFTSTLEWAWGVVQAAPPPKPESAAAGAGPAGSASLGYALPTGVSMHALSDACLEDLSGRRVVCLRDGGGSTMIVANNPVPPVLVSFYFEVRLRTTNASYWHARRPHRQRLPLHSRCS